MNSIKRKISAWRRRIAKEQPQAWMARYRRFSDQAFADLVPVPTTADAARAKVDRLERHLRRLHAVRPPYATNRMDMQLIRMIGAFQHFTLFPRF